MQKKVLVCDDAKGIIEITRIVLEDKGYLVYSCTDGSLVLEMISIYNPDIILLDLWMPKKGGEEILITLKSNPKIQNIPVIIISADSDIEEIARNNNASGFLVKPFSIKRLEEMVNKYAPMEIIPEELESVENSG